MAFALYSGEMVLGFFPIGVYCGIADAAEKYGRSRKGKGTIPFLLAFFDTGATEEPRKVARDITKLLTSGTRLPKYVTLGFQYLRKLLRKVEGEAWVGEA